MLMRLRIGRSDRAVGKEQTGRAGELRLAVDEKHTLRRDLIPGFQAGPNNVNIIA